MKNNESLPKKEAGVRLTSEQKNNNPNGFWEGFLEQAVNRLVRDFEDIGDIYETRNTEKNSDSEEELPLRSTIRADLKELVGKVPAGLKNFISEEELLRLAIDRYKNIHSGFGNVSGLGAEYKKLWKTEREKRTSKFLEKLHGEEDEYDFDNVPIEEEVAKLVEEEPDIEQSEVEAFRQNLWDGFSKMKI